MRSDFSWLVPTNVGMLTGENRLNPRTLLEDYYCFEHISDGISVATSHPFNRYGTPFIIFVSLVNKMVKLF